MAFIVGGAGYMGLFNRSATCDAPLAEGLNASGADSGAKTPAVGVPRPLAGAAMGALYGVSASPCSTPALLAILALVAARGSVGRGAVLLIFYSIGQSFLVAAAGLATSAFQGLLESASGRRALDLLRKAGGAVIIAFGLYVLARPYL